MSWITDHRTPEQQRTLTRLALVRVEARGTCYTLGYNAWATDDAHIDAVREARHATVVPGDWQPPEGKVLHIYVA